MADKQKTLSRAYTFNRKVYTPHSVDVPEELLKRDQEYVAAKAARQAAEAEGESVESTVAAPRAQKAKQAKRR